VNYSINYNDYLHVHDYIVFIGRIFNRVGNALILNYTNRWSSHIHTR